MWALKWSFHKGSITRRDIAMPEIYETREEALAAYQKHKEFCRSTGYQIWYADLINPNRETEHL